MEVNLTYDELSDYVIRHYDKRLEFAREGERTLRATYRAGILSQSVSLQVAEIEDNKIFVAFTGGMLVNMAMKWFSEKISTMLGAGINVYKGHYLIVDLKEMPKAEALAAALDIRTIEFEEQQIRIGAALK